MAGLTEADLDEIFEYHAPTDEQREQYLKIRAGAKQFAKVILQNTPPCPDQTVAIRKLRESVMVANAAVALGGRY